MEEETNQKAEAPADPFSAMGVGAVAIHVMFQTLRGGGFGRRDALTLIAKVIVEQGRAATDDS